MSARSPSLVSIGCLVAWLAGCAANDVIPAPLEHSIDRSVAFPDLRSSPDSYRGRLVVLGGEVLSAKQLKSGTRIEVLQIPLSSAQEPGVDRTTSEGRLLAIQRDFLDPATIPPGTRVTIVGEVTGATTLPLDETEYTYPTLEIRHLKVWPPALTAARNRPPRSSPGLGLGLGRWPAFPYYW
jgi:outer membrane lipoprotein